MTDSHLLGVDELGEAGSVHDEVPVFRELELYGSSVDLEFLSHFQPGLRERTI